jgi:hypothetical protein
VSDARCSLSKTPSLMRVSSYSVTVLNEHDSDNGNWNPQSIKANINFRGKQAVYEFPVGVTTLTWYAAPK